MGKGDKAVWVEVERGLGGKYLLIFGSIQFEDHIVRQPQYYLETIFLLVTEANQVSIRNGQLEKTLV
jgi:hypothetical protein